MDRYLEELLKSKKTPVLTAERYEAAIHHIRHPDEKVDPHFKHWVKERKFQIVDLPGLGLKDVLVAPRKEKVYIILFSVQTELRNAAISVRA